MNPKTEIRSLSAEKAVIQRKANKWRLLAEITQLAEEGAGSVDRRSVGDASIIYWSLSASPDKLSTEDETCRQYLERAFRKINEDARLRRYEQDIRSTHNCFIHIQED